LCECEECEAQPEAWRQIAKEVDHIDGLGPSGPRGFDWTNLQALSKSHHSRKTASQDGGFGNRKKRADDPLPF
jgi:5-methylcytosine-specific restriction protein A